MPYLVLRHPYEVGNVTFWPSGPRSRMGIADPAIRERVRRILRRAVDPFALRPISRQTLIYHGLRGNLTRLSNVQRDDVERAVLVLMCSVLAARTSLECTAENFTTVHWDFGLGNDTAVKHEDGSLLRVRSIVFPGFRHSWDVAPTHVALPSAPLSVDEPLLTALAAYLAQDPAGPNQLRLVDGLRWLRFACTNDHSFADGARIMAMATAFEFILQKFGNRTEFAKRIDRACSIYERQGRTVGASVPAWSNRYQPVELTRGGWWAYDFYSLRSRIVHGALIETAEYYAGRRDPHFVVSVRVFAACVKSMLEKTGLYRHTPLDDYHWSRMLDSLWPSGVHAVATGP